MAERTQALWVERLKFEGSLCPLVAVWSGGFLAFLNRLVQWLTCFKKLSRIANVSVLLVMSVQTYIPVYAMECYSIAWHFVLWFMVRKE